MRRHSQEVRWRQHAHFLFVAQNDLGSRSTSSVSARPQELSTAHPLFDFLLLVPSSLSSRITSSASARPQELATDHAFFDFLPLMPSSLSNRSTSSASLRPHELSMAHTLFDFLPLVSSNLSSLHTCGAQVLCVGSLGRVAPCFGLPMPPALRVRQKVVGFLLPTWEPPHLDHHIDTTTNCVVDPAVSDASLMQEPFQEFDSTQVIALDLMLLGHLREQLGGIGGEVGHSTTHRSNTEEHDKSDVHHIMMLVPDICHHGHQDACTGCLTQVVLPMTTVTTILLGFIAVLVAMHETVLSLAANQQHNNAAAAATTNNADSSEDGLPAAGGQVLPTATIETTVAATQFQPFAGQPYRLGMEDIGGDVTLEEPGQKR